MILIELIIRKKALKNFAVMVDLNLFILNSYHTDSEFLTRRSIWSQLESIIDAHFPGAILVKVNFLQSMVPCPWPWISIRRV